MKTNRREFLRAWALATPAAGLSALGRGEPAAEPIPVFAARGRLLMNHLGFIPEGAKTVIVENPPELVFSLRRVLFTGARVITQHVLTRALSEARADLGRVWVGDFTEVKGEGIYEVRCGPLHSRLFLIQHRLYDYPLRILFNYFPSQRCGDSLTGYNAPCHEQDGRRMDTREYVDVSGGWHQSCDCRKWMLGTPFGLLGLTRLGLINRPRWDRGQIEEELRWGNSYFLKMIRPDGGLMDHVIVPLGWEKERDLYPNDAPLPAYYLTIVGEAMVAEYFKNRDSKYRVTCVEAARRLWDYVNRKGVLLAGYNPPIVPPFHGFLRQWFRPFYPGSALAVGDSLYAAWWLYQATGDGQYLDAACRDATRLCDLQLGGDVEQKPEAACFREGPGKAELALTTYYGFFGPVGLCELVRTIEKHPERPRWLEAIQRLAAQFCAMSRRNGFGLIPCYWHANDPGKGRRAGGAFYQYFHNRFGLRIGVNHDITARAIFLLRAYDLLGDRLCLDTASRQIDWVLGANPYDMSTVEGVGFNQPQRLISAEFFPPTPQIPGAVMTGIIGNDDDSPLDRGWVAHEYDLPPTSLLIWLLAEFMEVR
jgi:hypothetical protein